MVLADAEPINRMSWRSTRRPGHPSDDEDRESVMLGGVRLRGGDDDNAPLALEDPWWSKLTGFRSQRKAIVFSFFVIALGIYFIIAGTVQERLTRATQLAERLAEVDTSHNSLRAWLDWMKLQKFSTSRNAQIQQIDQRMALQCAAQGWSHSCTRKVFAEARRKRLQAASGGLGPQVSETITYVSRGRSAGIYGSELRLPVGVALAYHKDLFSRVAHDCATGDIFHFECYTANGRRKKSMDAMRRSLFRVIMHVSSEEGKSLSGKRLELLKTLVSQAQKGGVTTEVERQDLNAENAVALKGELERLEVREDSGSTYQDIMLYPRTSMLLYRGAFLGLKFHGKGDLYHRRASQVAYTGEWQNGRIHGRGKLFAEDGNAVWDGVFRGGVPVKPWWVV